MSHHEQNDRNIVMSDPQDQGKQGSREVAFGEVKVMKEKRSKSQNHTE